MLGASFPKAEKNMTHSSRLSILALALLAALLTLPSGPAEARARCGGGELASWLAGATFDASPGCARYATNAYFECTAPCGQKGACLSACAQGYPSARARCTRFGSLAPALRRARMVRTQARIQLAERMGSRPSRWIERQTLKRVVRAA